ncbi:hypothetical protein BC361_29750 [Ensifer sp. LC54]|nr:hypothetical protein BC363_30345 [Ensifer sp. LC384]OCP19851.1 hypothetical protein BC361_29750 [Ensifer sp. LC54]
MAQSAVELFLSFLITHNSHLSIVSSLHANAAELGHSGSPVEDARDVELARDLARDQLINMVSYKEILGRDYDSEEYRIKLETIWTDFRLLVEKKYRAAEKLTLARMLVYGLHGHCFFVLEEAAIAFYAHDDIGFGVIGLGTSANVDLGKEFLLQADACRDFHSVIV